MLCENRSYDGTIVPKHVTVDVFKHWQILLFMYILIVSC
jgi:hypothetical protein